MRISDWRSDVCSSDLLRHQGLSFVERFDANSYLYITRAMDYFDVAEEHGGLLANEFKGTNTRFCVISFDTDWLYHTREHRQIVYARKTARGAGSLIGEHGKRSWRGRGMVVRLNIVGEGRI